MAKGDKLTPKQDKYALALFKGDSQRTAYRKAYPSSKKWGDNTVDAKASRLAADDKVKARLEKLRAKADKEALFTLDDLLAEIGKVIFVREVDFYNDDGSCKQLSELTDNQKAAIKSYTVKSVHVGEGEYEDVPQFVFHDKAKFVDMAMKNKGGYEKDNKRDIIATVEQVTKLPVRDPKK